jgi:SOS-response transcriptional repressor LexA
MRKRKIPILSPVYAGTPTPLDYWKIEKFRTIREPRNAKLSDRFAAVPVCGDSLIEQGIFNGDILIFKFTEFAVPSRLCIWQTPEGITAKFAEKSGEDEFITLHNRSGWRKCFFANEIKMIGVVVRVERDL